MAGALNDVLGYFLLVVAGFFVWAALSPFEVMGWWAGWFGDEIYQDEIPPDGLLRTVPPNRDSYIVYMSGVGRVGGETFLEQEKDFLRRLAQVLPQSVIIDDIFPYSVNNLALTGQPFFARVWRWALDRKVNGPKLMGYLINIRNIWQLMISADKRYGPMFNQGIAEVIFHGLSRYEYDANSQTPVFLVSHSGSAQIALGATRYLREWITGPVYVLMLGGIFSSDPGLVAAEHVYHIYGKLDGLHNFSLLAPGRWSWMPASDWNRARRQGRVTLVDVGPIGHTGVTGYLDRMSELPDGTTYLERTVQVIKGIVRKHTPKAAPGLASVAGAPGAQTTPVVTMGVGGAEMVARIT